MTTNRLTPYEAGWLTMLVSQQICTEAEAREAMNRVARAAVDEMERLRKEKKRLKRRRRHDD